MKFSLRCALVASLATLLCSSSSAELIYGIANQGVATNLISFDSGSPTNLQSASFVSGLQANETLVGIDFRPATGQLYGLGSTSRLYTINTSNGAATPVAASFAPSLNGFSYGFDFNPVIDRTRVVTETNQNLVLNPITGTVQTVAPNVAYGAADPNFGVDPNVVGSAYTNNFAGATATTLYGLDTGLDILVTQVAATGALTTVGPLGLDVAAAGGFDISGSTGVAYAALLPAGSSVSRLYSINLLTGTAINVGAIDGGLIVSALAIVPVPEPATAGLGLTAMLGLAAFRRRVA